jgi:hypothetical protein
MQQTRIVTEDPDDLAMPEITGQHPEPVETTSGRRMQQEERPIAAVDGLDQTSAADGLWARCDGPGSQSLPSTRTIGL